MDTSEKIKARLVAAGKRHWAGDNIADFIEDFYRRHGIALDPVYSGKLMWGLFKDLEAGAYSGKSVLALHTGGLQGLRGYPALLANLTEMGFQGLQ